MGSVASAVGPSVVAIGGGHGLSASLRAIRRYAGAITAVVSVADDGGSSGRLRDLLPDLPAPGDVRRCLGALAADGSSFGPILEHRFREGDLAGHAFGNLLLVSLALELGSFSAAVDELADRVGAVGRVLPATTAAVSLEGRGAGPDGVVASAPGALRRVVGQVAVQNTVGLVQVRLQPPDPASDPAVRASILGADQVVLGPGSLFTSVLAAAIVPAVADGLRTTRAQRVLVANLSSEVPETVGMSVGDEVRVLADHGIDVDAVVVDPGRGGGGDVVAEGRVERPVADAGGSAHDPAKLAAVLKDLALGRS